MLIQTLAKTTKISSAKLLSISDTASKRYKTYVVPKRTGGLRTIAHPSRELKAIQRWLAKSIFAKFPVHNSAMAYREGSGIRANAEKHVRTRYTNRYDFSNFFPSFTQERITEFLQNESGQFELDLSEEDLRFIGNVVCKNGRLTIGAPSSPMITNIMMFGFDREMFAYCAARDLIYTRYADDIFVSSFGTNQLRGVESKIGRVKKELPYIRLRLNRRKTSKLSKKRSRRIAGVIVTPDHKLSIGRVRKREIKSLIYQWCNENLEPQKLHYMRGLLAFAKDIEPNFEVRLRAKYGDDAIDQILKHPSLKEIPDPEFYL